MRPKTASRLMYEGAVGLQVRVRELEQHRNELQELCTAQITKIRELDQENEQLKRGAKMSGYDDARNDRVTADAARDYEDMRKFQAKFIEADQRLRAMELVQAEVDKAVKKMHDLLMEMLNEHGWCDEQFICMCKNCVRIRAVLGVKK